VNPRAIRGRGGVVSQCVAGHIHEWTIRVVDTGHVEEKWTYWEGGQEPHVSSFTMTRRAAE